MPVWPALIAAPLIALTNLSLTYALVLPACALQMRAALHVVPVISVLLLATCTALAFRVLESTHSRASDSGERSAREHFVASVGVLLGALSTLVVIALWIPLWFVSPCAT